jgi:phytoene/squalene synthetase
MLKIRVRNIRSNSKLAADLPAKITRAASKQTYYTIRFLVDRDRVVDAYRAYAYFRWLDDRIDSESGSLQEKLALIDRQVALLNACYRQETLENLTPEEQMLVDMVKNDQEQNSGLQHYITNMMKLLTFDVSRRNRIITQLELTEYTQMLSVAVTEALFYFIGHNTPPTYRKNRYMAVSGAHVVHMLRDLRDDLACGYINIPAEYFQAHNLLLNDLDESKLRAWTYERVELARRYFRVGRTTIARVKNRRSRLAGLAYLARFEWMLKAIEKDGYKLRSNYPERKSLRAGLWMAWRVITAMLNPSLLPRQTAGRPVTTEQWEKR